MSTPAASHQRRSRMPSSANGKTAGLSMTRTPGQPQIVPSATKAAIQIVGVPNQ